MADPEIADTLVAAGLKDIAVVARSLPDFIPLADLYELTIARSSGSAAQGSEPFRDALRPYAEVVGRMHSPSEGATPEQAAASLARRRIATALGYAIRRGSGRSLADLRRNIEQQEIGDQAKIIGRAALKFVFCLPPADETDTDSAG